MLMSLLYVNKIYHIIIKNIYRVFNDKLEHEPHKNYSLVPYDPDPLILYKSHYSHSAPMWPKVQESSPGLHPPLQFTGKL